MFAILAAALFLAPANTITVTGTVRHSIIAPDGKPGKPGKSITSRSLMLTTAATSSDSLLYSNNWVSSGGISNWGSPGSGGALTLQGGSAGGSWTYAADGDKRIGQVTFGSARGGDVTIGGGAGNPPGGIHLKTDHIDRVWLDSDGVLHYNGSEVATIENIDVRFRRALWLIFLSGLNGIIVGGCILWLWKNQLYGRWLAKQVSADEGPYRSSGNPK